MADVTVFSVVSTAESALKKLKKGQIPVYGCKKRGAEFIFGVKDKHAKKVFAIFSKPCYNIRVARKSAKKRFAALAALRAGLIAGAAAFVLAAYVSGFYCLKIEVTGSGAYLKDAVGGIITSLGGGTGKPFSAMDFPLAEGKILSLPQVTFCNVTKRGSVLYIDVETGPAATPQLSRLPLKSDVDGRVIKITAICGSPAVEAGGMVKKGDVLIYPYEQVGEEQAGCLAVGYAELECSGTARFAAPDGGEESVRRAYASLLIDPKDILTRSHTVVPIQGGNAGENGVGSGGGESGGGVNGEESGVEIVINFTYLRKLSINLN